MDGNPIQGRKYTIFAVDLVGFVEFLLFFSEIIIDSFCDQDIGGLLVFLDDKLCQVLESVSRSFIAAAG